MPSQHPLIALELDWKDCVLSLDISLWIVGGVIVIAYPAYHLFRGLWKGRLYIPEVELNISSKPGVTFKVRRDTTNLYIAHRILLELVTRKAAIPFDPDNDVIVEVYDSWYKLFGIIRDEIKGLPGNYLLGHKQAQELVNLTLEILNKGLRPHLTTYQADFRRFYNHAKDLDANKNLSPQKIQQLYPETKYKELVASMLQVNGLLKEYADQLCLLIHGEKCKSDYFESGKP